MTTTTPSLEKTLKNAKTVAMIGCSPKNFRTSNYAAKFLMDKGLRFIPVNPEEEKILGEKCYKSLTDIDENIEIDIVNIFRNSKHSADAVRDVIKWKEKTGQNPVVWTQLDVSSEEAEELAEEHQIPYVKNRCIMVEWDHYMN